MTSFDYSAQHDNTEPPGGEDERVWPAALTAVPQWVTWRLEPNPGKPEKPLKMPYTPGTPQRASTTSSRTWGTFDKAITSYERMGHGGVGFVFGANDEFVFVDLDQCRDPQTGELNYLAEWVLKTLDSYSEVSQSGKGVHIIALGELPAGHSRKLEPVAEVYTEKRFVAMTGNHIAGTPTDIMHRPDEVKLAHSVLETISHLEKNVLGGAFGARRRLLWEGDKSDFIGDSEADFSMLTFLAYTLNDPEVIEAVMRRTKLVRSKWDDPRGDTTWLGYQIQEAMRLVETARQSAVPDALDRQTDLGLARIFVEQHGSKIRYVYTWSKWIVWDGRQWVLDDSGAVARLLINTVETLFAAALDESDPQKQADAIRWAVRCESARSIQNALYLASMLPGVPIGFEDLDPDPWLFNVENGIVNWKTGQLLPHNPTFLMTKMGGTVWDTEATCPLWLKTLERILPDEATRRFFQKAMGYSATGLTWEQCLFFLYGRGQNGKSTVLEIAMALFGEYAGKTRAETLMVKRGQAIPNDVAALVGLRFVATSELGQNQKIDESLLKDLTGGDTISARFMRAEFFDFHPVLKPWMYGNHKPVIDGTDDGIWRRLHLVPFTVRIPDAEKDPALKDKLMAELPGILQWVAEGVRMWREENLNAPEEVSVATADYRDQMDTFAEFLEARCVIGPGESEKSAQLYTAYTYWTEYRREKPASQRAFGLALGDRGFVKGKVGQGRGWKGLRLKTTAELAEEADAEPAPAPNPFFDSFSGNRARSN